MLKSFSYVKPSSLSQALHELNTGPDDAIVISGGTDVLVQLRDGIISPKKIVDVSDLGELKFIEDRGDSVWLGGATTFSQIVKNEFIKTNFPSLFEAAREVGSPQIRNVGTLAGNTQTASPAGDGLVALYALDATVELISEVGIREINISKFIIGPKRTTKRHDEVIRCFKFKKQSWDYDVFFKVGKRNAHAISIVNGVVKINFNEDKTIKDVRMVLGAVAPTPLKLHRAEKYLIGKPCDEDAVNEIRNIVGNDVSPISDLRGSKEFRRYMAATKCARYLKLAGGGMY